MKGIIAVALFALIAAASASFSCPNDPAVEKNVVLKHPGGNNKYYFRCRNGMPVMVACQPGLTFDEERLTCSYPKPSVRTPARSCPPQTTPQDNYLIPNLDDCGSFYQCVWGKPTLQYCPAGLKFDKNEHKCLWPNQAVCA